MEDILKKWIDKNHGRLHAYQHIIDVIENKNYDLVMVKSLAGEMAKLVKQSIIDDETALVEYHTKSTPETP